MAEPVPVLLDQLADYFTPIKESSLSFLNATITSKRVDEDLEKSQNGGCIKDLAAHIKGGELVLTMNYKDSSILEPLSRSSLLKVSQGSVLFKDYDYEDFSKHCPHQVIYNNEKDVHIPHLTVEQTVDFAISCKFNHKPSVNHSIRDVLLKTFGLERARHTIVGDDHVRGISGGERKRLSIIESFIANGSLYLWDNSTKGLDSSTALEFIQCLRSMAKLTRTINIVKISQASDKLVEQFDKILIILENYQVFYGTVSDCIQFFKDLGFRKDPHLCDIEFLTAIINKNLKSPKVSSEEDIYTHWIKSKYYAGVRAQLSVNQNNNHVTNPISKIDPQDLSPLYGVSTYKQLKSCVIRAFQRALGDRTYLTAQLISIIIQSLVIGSLFYSVPKTTIGSFSRGSLTFFALLFFTFNCLADVPISFVRRPVISKQRQMYFYQPWIENLASTIYEFPYKFILVLVFTIILYFLAHFQYSAARFFVFLLFLVTANFVMSVLFQTIAYLSPTVAVANAAGGVLLLAISMYASYVIYLKSMRPWFKWISYINPVMYAMESMLSNELFNMDLDCTDSIIPRGPTYDNVSFSHKVCGWQGAKLGHSSVKGREYLNDALGYSYQHVWRNFGILIGFSVFFTVFSLLASQYITPRYDGKTFKLFKKKNYPKRSSEAHDDVPLTDVEFFQFESVMDKIEKNTETDNSLCTEQAVLKSCDTNVVSWKNVNYTVNGKHLLKDVSGYISSGLTALMGESGAGKTTLLNVISQRIEKGVVNGELLVNGCAIKDKNAFKRSVGYVQQQDVHIKLLTVWESLEISCRLKGDGDLLYAEKVLDMLKLPREKLFKDLNPAEKKLLSIGVELVTKPSLLLFLDEPTSGLDSEAAVTIIKFLKKLTAQGQAVFCTIHQPSKNIFSYFDNVLLLRKGGECVYFGPRDQIYDYVKRHYSISYDKETENPAELVLDAIGAGANSDSNIDWLSIWNSSKEKKDITDIISQLEDKALADGTNYIEFLHETPSYLTQLFIVTKRQYLSITRDRSYMSSKILLNVVAGLFIGFTFWKTKHNIIGLQNLIFTVFMALCISDPLINQLQAKAFEPKEVFITRESKSNTYHWSVLLLSQLLVEIPLVLIGSTFLYLCFYFCLGVDNSPHIAGVFYLNYMLFAIYYLTFGLWLMYMCTDLQTSAVFVAFLFSFTVSFCGVMQPYALFPNFWKFMYRVSPYTYFVDTFVSLLLHERKVICDTSEFAPSQPLAGQTCGQFMKDFIDEHGGYLLNPNAPFVCAYCSYASGDEFLSIQNMGYHNRWRNFGICCAFVAFNLFAMFSGFYITSVKKLWSVLFEKFSMVLLKKKRFGQKHG